MFKQLRQAAERNAASWSDLYEKMRNQDAHRVSKAMLNTGMISGIAGTAGMAGFVAGNAGVSGFLSTATAAAAKIGIVTVAGASLPAAVVIAGGAMVAGSVLAAAATLKEQQEYNREMLITQKAAWMPKNKAVSIGDYLRGMRDIIASKVFPQKQNPLEKLQSLSARKELDAMNAARRIASLPMAEQRSETLAWLARNSDQAQNLSAAFSQIESEGNAFAAPAPGV